MRRFHSIMKSFQSLFVILSIFLLIEETISSKKVLVPRDGISDPLALIKKRESVSLELAIPHSTDNIEMAGYSYEDNEDENGRKDDFYIACPVYNDSAKNLEKKWKKTDDSFQESHLFILLNYVDADKVCQLEAKPSINRLKLTDEMKNPIYCGKSEAEIYEVGYPVLVNDIDLTVVFMSIYKICHSKAKGVGTLYTIQQLVSPDLLLLEKKTWYQPNISQAFKSYLDEDLRRVKKLYRKIHTYRFVGPYFMPTRIWERTTMFPFNFTPVKHYSIFRGLLRADKFIQVFSKKTKTPLTLYSGTYEETVTVPSTRLCGLKDCVKDMSIRLLWKILVDSTDHAVAIVTQLTQLDCDFTENILCQDYDTRDMLETYEKGGCMYKCPVTDTMIEKLDLPATQLGLNHKGVLSLRVPKKPKKQKAVGSSDAQAQSQTEYSDMADFMGSAAAFAAAVAAVDGGLALIVEADAGVQADADDAGGGQGHSDGAHNDGHGEGGGDTGGGGGGGGGGGFGDGC